MELYTHVVMSEKPSREANRGGLFVRTFNEADNEADNEVDNETGNEVDNEAGNEDENV